MYKIKRFSTTAHVASAAVAPVVGDTVGEELANKKPNFFKRTGKKIKKKISKFKENPKKETKETAKSIVKFAKENPQDFAIEGASLAIPIAGAALSKSKNAKGVWATIGALPLGSAGIATRHAIKAYKENKK